MFEDGPGLILILTPGLPSRLRNRIRERLRELGATVSVVEGGARQYLEVFGDGPYLDTLSIDSWKGVERMIAVGTPAPHAAPQSPPEPATLHVGDLEIGPGELVVAAGPCAIEEEERTFRIADSVAAMGVQLFRGGAFKPRSSPYAFGGLGSEGLRILAEVKKRTGLKIITEVLDPRAIEEVSEVADIFQVGSRNMQNFSLLRELGHVDRPVFIKRGFSATIEELLLSAEYVLTSGNAQVILCERGIRSAAADRNVILDLGTVIDLKRRTHLPVFVDPSHGGGKRQRVGPLARAAVAAGCDGLMIEVHDAPERALSDGQQALPLGEFKRLMEEIAVIRAAISPKGTSNLADDCLTTTGGD